MTKEQLIKETKEFYSNKENLSKNYEGTCFYWQKNGKRCAIGRLLSGKEAKRLESIFHNIPISVAIGEIKKQNLQKKFPNLISLFEEYGYETLTEIQLIHDLGKQLLT